MIKITIENEVTGDKTTVQYEHVEIRQELGYFVHHGLPNELPVIESNGQHRMEVRAWSGCPSWSSFVAKDER